MAIKSVLGQTEKDFELILFGDAPDEATRLVAQRYTESRITIYENSTRKGLSYTLNQISKVASRPLLARMDGDDIMHPDRLHRQLCFMKDNPKTDLVGTRAYLIDENGGLLGAYKEPPLPTNPRGYLTSAAFTHPTVLGRTDWFRANPYDEGLLRAEDKELWLRTNEFSKFRKMDERLLYYRVNSRVSRQKQGKDAGYDRKVMKAFRHLDSRGGVGRRIAKSMVKQATVAALDSIGRSDLIFRTKYTPIPQAEHEENSSVLRSVYGRP